jgi:penicillin G amidase
LIKIKAAQSGSSQLPAARRFCFSNVGFDIAFLLGQGRVGVRDPKLQKGKLMLMNNARNNNASKLNDRFGLVVAGTAAVLLATSPVTAQPATPIPELRAAVQVARDADGIAHISATNEHDLFFMQGWVETSDRLFQMDVLRRLASGTLAELVGPAALSRDVELRAFGLRHTAEASLPLLLPAVQAAFEAYSDGVNAYVAAHPLPTEYQLLGLATIEPWTSVDIMAIAKLQAFGTAFDTVDLRLTEALFQYTTAFGAAGQALFFEDLFRAQPFDPAATIPDAEQILTLEAALLEAAEEPEAEELAIDPEVVDLAREYLERTAGIPELTPHLVGSGSNMWVIAGAHTDSGRPLLANDPHPTQLSIPTTFYPIHLRAPGIDVVGGSFPGTPFVILGHNRFIAWGATSNPLDLTDWFQEQLCPAGPLFGVFHLGECKPVIPRPEVFRYNEGGELTTATPGGIVDGVFIPPVIPVVPHRGDGPIVSVGATTALSVQFTGFSPTRDPNGFYLWNRARDLDDFMEGLQFIDAGANSWVYADVRGSIAYFTDSEVPLREDLQAGVVAGLPPFFIRNGTGGNDWRPKAAPQSPDAVPYEILPFEEMPQIVNPPAGVIINSNNDQLGLVQDNNALNQLRPGGGILYLSPGYASIRAGRVTELIHGLIEDEEELDLRHMEAIQADVVLLDAKVFVPYILDAFENAGEASAPDELKASADDPRVAEAVARFAEWDFSTPTGIPEGYDASDEDGELGEPSGDEVEASIAATIYAVWRSRMLVNSIDSVLPAGFQRPRQEEAVTALRHLLDNFESNQGIGVSGLNFFDVSGVPDPAVRRDIILLQSLADALDLLASGAFDDAFGGSADQDDYRWGLLHRVVISHPLDTFFDVPPAGGLFPPPLPGLPGIPSDGGFEVVDASSHDVRGASAHEFTFDRPDVPSTVPASRFVAELLRSGPEARYSLPGGISGELFRTFPTDPTPLYINLLPKYLTNDSIPLRTRPGDFRRGGSQQVFVPGRR